MMEIIKAIIYGIVEGITEWLPISSTGHLILVEQLIPFKGTSESFFEMFDVVIQLGAIMAVVVLFWFKIWPFYKKDNMTMRDDGIVKSKNDFTIGKLAVSMDAFRMWVKIIVACVPAIIYGIMFDDMVEAAFANPVGNAGATVKTLIVATMLIIVGILFIIIERRNRDRVPAVDNISDITYKAALIIGCAQLVAAALPGTSRSGATILAAIMIGISRKAAAEFTFFLGIPVMFGASLLKIVKFGFSFTTLELTVLLVGTIVSFVVSMIIVKALMGFIKKHDFQVFGWYRIVLGIVVLLCLFI